MSDERKSEIMIIQKELINEMKISIENWKKFSIWLICGVVAVSIAGFIAISYVASLPYGMSYEYLPETITNTNTNTLNERAE